MQKSLFLCLAAICLNGAAAFAQSAPPDHVDITLPYEVTIEKTVLPAGEYRFERLNFSSSIVNVTNVHGGKVVAHFMGSPTGEAESASRSEAVLKQVDGKYYMEELRIVGRPAYQLHVPAEKR